MPSTPLLTVRNRMTTRMHLVFGAMILCSLFLLVVVREALIGALGLFFFGFCYVFLLNRHRKQPIALMVEPEGVRIANPAIFLPWAEITGVGTWRLGRNEMVGFDLRDRDAIWNQLVDRGMNRSILEMNTKFGYDLFVNSATMEPPAADVAAAIQAELERRTENPPSAF